MTPRLFPYTPERDVYRLLGVRPTASPEEIHAACRRLARTFHPDRNGSVRAAQEMQVVNVVRQVMSDPHQRARYDSERHRFHAQLGRPASAGSVIRSSVPTVARRSRRSWAGRYVRAAAAGMKVTLLGLVPPRCRRCRTVVGTEDVCCAACGAPRLTGG